MNTEVSQPCIGIAVQCVGGVGENGAITFTGTVTNCGNNTLVGVTVTNFVNGGQSHVTFINTLITNQVASFSGSWIPSNACLASTATFVAQGVDQFTTHPRTVTASANTTCSDVLTPGIKVTKTCPVNPVGPGQMLTFSGTVSNTGNVMLTNIIVLNSQPAPNTPVFTRATLAPGEVVSFNGSYTAPASCSVDDTLTATAASRCGVLVASTATATCPILTTPRLAMTFLCPTNPIVPGSVVTYTGSVSNSGNVILNNVTVAESGQPLPPNSGLVGYWAFNETSGSAATDSSGNGNNGNIINAARVPGQSGNGLSFNGTSAYVDIANSASLNFSGAITMAAWIKPQAVNGLRNIFGHGPTTSPVAGVSLRIQNGNYEAAAFNGAATPILSVAMPAGDVGGTTFASV